MCEFCKTDIFCEEEIMRKIAEKPIDMGLLSNVMDLNTWLMRDEDDIKLQLCLSESQNGNDIAILDIPIKYCPMCGRKL